MNDEHQQRMQEIEASKLDDVQWVKRNLPQFYNAEVIGDRHRKELSGIRSIEPSENVDE